MKKNKISEKTVYDIYKKVKAIELGLALGSSPKNALKMYGSSIKPIENLTQEERVSMEEIINAGKDSYVNELFNGVKSLM